MENRPSKPTNFLTSMMLFLTFKSLLDNFLSFVLEHIPTELLRPPGGSIRDVCVSLFVTRPRDNLPWCVCFVRAQQ